LPGASIPIFFLFHHSQQKGLTMLNSLQNPLSLLGRVLIALLFVPAGFSKIGGFAGTAGYIASKGVPLPEVAAAIAIAVELGLGLLLLIGFQTRWAALGIAVFTAVITFIFHAFWSMPAEQVMMQQQAFFKNIAVVGGLLTIAAWGAGAWSVDGKLKD
jgi:putative oxidoreductase